MHGYLASLASLITNQPPSPDDWYLAFAAVVFSCLGVLFVVAYVDDME